MSNDSKLSSVDRLVVRLDRRYTPSDWLLMRDRPRWHVFADWVHGPEDGWWLVDVQGATIREALIRALWASRLHR